MTGRVAGRDIALFGLDARCAISAQHRGV